MGSCGMWHAHTHLVCFLLVDACLFLHGLLLGQCLLQLLLEFGHLVLKAKGSVGGVLGLLFAPLQSVHVVLQLLRLRVVRCLQGRELLQHQPGVPGLKETPNTC